MINQLMVLPSLQVVMLSSVSDLLTYIDEQQLTPEFGGTLEYCHSEWVIFRTVRTRAQHWVWGMCWRRPDPLLDIES